MLINKAMEGDDLHDWEEVLHESSPKSPNHLPIPDLHYSDSIVSDYFSLDSTFKRVPNQQLEEGFVDSKNPSWIDPQSPHARNIPTRDIWSDSNSQGSETCCDLGDFDVNGHLCKSHDFGDHDELGFGGINGPEKTGSDSNDFDVQKDLDSEKMDEIQNLDDMKFGDAGDDGEAHEELKILGTERENGCGEDPKDEDEGERRIVWWKVPSELIRFCVFRVSPIWSFSVAAALMGFVILGRKLYRMKRKRWSMQLKVTVDDKKVSQFMNRAARLNEAFSIVRRDPILRPSIPSAGITQWPVMSLR